MINSPNFKDHDRFPVAGHYDRIFDLRLASAAFIAASEAYHGSPADGPIAKNYASRKRALLQEIGMDNEAYQNGRHPYVLPSDLKMAKVLSGPKFGKKPISGENAPVLATPIPNDPNQ